jgi:TRAP transporter TAXI family solute receptor
VKNLLAIIFIVILATGVLAGCGEKQQPAKPQQLILATGGVGGTYHPYGVALAKLLNGKIANISITPQATGASLENLRLVNRKDAQLAIVQSDLLHYAQGGREMFKDKLSNIRAIATLYPEAIQLVVRPDSGINTFVDIKGKKFGVGPPGSGTEANFRQLIGISGFDYKALVPAYVSFDQGAEQFRDNLIDGFIVTAGVPNPAIASLGPDNIRVIGLSEEMIANLTLKYPFLTPYTIRPNTYQGQPVAVRTLAVQATLVASSEVSADIIYEITKNLFENRAELAQAIDKGQELSPETALVGIATSLHSGAARYYRERGLIK